MRAGAKLWFRGGLEEDGLEEDVSNSHAHTTNSALSVRCTALPNLARHGDASQSRQSLRDLRCMGCGASKPSESPESASEKQSIYMVLDVKPPESAATRKPPAAAAAELQRPTAIQKQAAAEAMYSVYSLQRCMCV